MRIPAEAKLTHFHPDSVLKREGIYTLPDALRDIFPPEDFARIAALLADNKISKIIFKQRTYFSNDEISARLDWPSKPVQ